MAGSPREGEINDYEDEETRPGKPQATRKTSVDSNSPFNQEIATKSQISVRPGPLRLSNTELAALVR